MGALISVLEWSKNDVARQALDLQLWKMKKGPTTECSIDGCCENIAEFIGVRVKKDLKIAGIPDDEGVYVIPICQNHFEQMDGPLYAKRDDLFLRIDY